MRTKEENDGFTTLSEILTQLPNSKKEKTRTSISPIKPKKAYPSTIFETADISFPQIIFDTPKEIDIQVGNMYIRSEATKQRFRVITHVEKHKQEIKYDELGEYIEIKKDEKSFSLLPIKEIHTRLQSHITRIDHTGINIPETVTEKKEWDMLISQLASETNIYNYPTGEIWPFILPVTEEEYAKDITEFPLGREPKFELVYDSYASIPTIQIDLETDLKREEVEKLLPAPYGMSFPEVADFFRSVYVDNPWSNLGVRFDIRFRNDHPGGDWDTGKWLVKDGKRMRA